MAEGDVRAAIGGRAVRVTPGGVGTPEVPSWAGIRADDGRG